ncbi:unnamed protein product [Schistosoma curassoni]|uniref:Dimer_Tnp_hAT domain-containing protein n=1 Tax=Schistosoma curassoni TaxID=6186 RepID=A0A183JCU3_9TREM|nr:unnamed protein product [Schistosoma curassoni]
MYDYETWPLRVEDIRKLLVIMLASAGITSVFKYMQDVIKRLITRWNLKEKVLSSSNNTEIYDDDALDGDDPLDDDDDDALDDDDH